MILPSPGQADTVYLADKEPYHSSYRYGFASGWVKTGQKKKKLKYYADKQYITIRRIGGIALLYVSRFWEVYTDELKNKEAWYKDGKYTKEDKIEAMLKDGSLMVIMDTLPHIISLSTEWDYYTHRISF